MALIHCEDLTKRFHQGKQAITAVNHVSMDICPHKITAICGPSGCGKSTLLHMLGLLMKPDEGKIIINGQEVKEGNDLPAIRNESFGYIFQEYALMEQDTVMENIALPFVEENPGDEAANDTIIFERSTGNTAAFKEKSP